MIKIFKLIKLFKKTGNKKEFGFLKFAFWPTQLISGNFIWFKFYFVAGRRFGGLNRYSVSHKKFELKYELDSLLV